jgi:hypothetical protein
MINLKEHSFNNGSTKPSFGEEFVVFLVGVVTDLFFPSEIKSNFLMKEDIIHSFSLLN